MMISPEGFIQECIDMTYSELICVRDELIEEIRNFEKCKVNPSEIMINPSPEVTYQCNLDYLGSLCELISKKYHTEFVWCDDKKDENYLFKIRDFLESKGLRYESTLNNQIKDRNEGKKYAKWEHIRALIYAMLTNQTKWHRIEPHFAEIDVLFFDYDPVILKSTSGEYFADKLFKLKCGNISTTSQMNALSYNFDILQSIEKEYGSLDLFVLSSPAHEIVQKLSKKSSKYKLKMLGEALAREYLRNVGIDGAKPDVHLCRFLSGSRMGNGNHTPATTREVYDSVLELSKATDLSMITIDNYIWSYCADGYGEVCTSTPRCSICETRQLCNYKK
ncbi:MAG: hypothetical protein Q8S24_01025 [Eubacteriales bacterium]|nr:hypothetical protein [Eubacteriales bacterium]